MGQSHTVGAVGGAHVLSQLNASNSHEATPNNVPDSPRRPSILDSEMLKRNLNSSENFSALTTADGASSHLTAQSNSTVPTNINLKAAALNLKIIQSPLAANYYVENEALEELKRKLALLSAQGDF